MIVLFKYANLFKIIPQDNKLNFTRKKYFGWTFKKKNKISTMAQSTLRNEGLLMFVGV